MLPLLLLLGLGLAVAASSKKSDTGPTPPSAATDQALADPLPEPGKDLNGPTPSSLATERRKAKAVKKAIKTKPGSGPTKAKASVKKPAKKALKPVGSKAQRALAAKQLAMKKKFAPKGYYVIRNKGSLNDVAKKFYVSPVAVSAVNPAYPDPTVNLPKGTKVVIP